jgi:hypothetical protein
VCSAKKKNRDFSSAGVPPPHAGAYRQASDEEKYDVYIAFAMLISFCHHIHIASKDYFFIPLLFLHVVLLKDLRYSGLIDMVGTVGIFLSRDDMI